MRLLRPGSSRKPANILLLAAAVTITLLVAATGGLWIYETTKTPPLIAPATIQEIMDAEQLSTDEHLPMEILPAETGSAKSSSQIQSSPCPASQCPDVAAAYAELMSNLSQMQINLNRTNDALLYFDERLNAIDSLKAELAAITESYHSSVRQMSALSEQLEAKLSVDEPRKPTLASVEMTPQKNLPPFRLIAIDRWQNQWNAVLELNGQITMIKPNSSRVGWHLVTIHSAKQTAVFKSDSGIEAELHVDG